MKKLEKEFIGTGEVKDVIFTRMHEYKLVHLYKRSDGYYEVIKIREQKESTAKIGGRLVKFEEKEIYPSGDNWDGKCVRDYTTALSYFKDMVRIHYGLDVEI